MSLRELRLRRGWSQERLADVSGVSVRTIQRIEGGRPPGSTTAAALADALQVDPDVLVAAAAEAEAAGGPAGEVSFAEALRRVREGWSDFEGRASRSEYWFVVLAVAVVVGAAAALDERLGAAALVLCLVPLVAVGSRRLRDAGQSPWWQLFGLAPMGVVVVVFVMAMPGKADESVMADPGGP
ncbi:DUF805 domain-containing protein [Nostocoides sp. Soil756]|uniref:DUF805 domain-containing protein n=1 Tax=Nostocoides sp. Soil756 TaxID=1736399 RepID=UPI0006F9C9B8|nr:DUF805 domain-containing protein [Tetrasphaera sp. Soil756]KRE61647.1 hypothetical protein ASG78_09885 [Tetrasphaera sp. Soil756]